MRLGKFRNLVLLRADSEVLFQGQQHDKAVMDLQNRIQLYCYVVLNQMIVTLKQNSGHSARKYILVHGLDGRPWRTENTRSSSQSLA